MTSATGPPNIACLITPRSNLGLAPRQDTACTESGTNYEAIQRLPAFTGAIETTESVETLESGDP